MQIWLNDLVLYLDRTSPWRVELALVSGKHHSIDAYSKAFPGLPIVRVENKTGSAEGRKSAISRLLKKRNPDLVVGVNVADLYLAANHARSKGFSGKVVLSLHAIAADLIEDVKEYSPLIDAVISTNLLTGQIIRTISGISDVRSLYAPYGVNMSTHARRHVSCVADNNPLRIAWVGRVEQEQKRVWDLLPILFELDSLKTPYILTIAGDGPEFSEIAKKLKPWIDCGSVVMLGAVSSLQLEFDVYDSHDVLLITSSWETGPIVAWEAMASGLVVVSSSYVGSGLENALQHGINCLLFPVGDCVLAAEAISSLSDTMLRQSLALQGQILVQTRYSKEMSNKRWIQVFEEIMNLPALPSIDFDEQQAPSGRLDKIFGIQMAEVVRRSLRITCTHHSPGSEWPHTMHGKADDSELLRIAAELDQRA